jgi:hypothetical protein
MSVGVPQLSLAVAVPVLEVAVEAVQSTVVLAGQVKLGGVVSSIQVKV